MGSGCGSVGRAVVSRPQRSAVRIQSSEEILYIYLLSTVQFMAIWLLIPKKKVLWNGPLAHFVIAAHSLFN